MNYKVVVVNGHPGSGKTTFEQMCISANEGIGSMISTIDYPKQLCRSWGWDGEKTPECRKFLSDLKDLMSKAPWADIPFETVCKKIESVASIENQVHPILIFVDAREPENIAKFVERYKENAVTVFIARPQDGDVEYSNHADANVENYKYDFIVYNESDLKNLELSAKLFVTKITE